MVEHRVTVSAAFSAQVTSWWSADHFTLQWNKGGTTDIGEKMTEKENKNDNVLYNLNGMRISRPSKGFYIQNGKKYLVP